MWAEFIKSKVKNMVHKGSKTDVTESLMKHKIQDCTC